MKRIEKVGEAIVKSITFPLRVIIGVCKAVEKNMPDTLEMPIEMPTEIQVESLLPPPLPSWSKPAASIIGSSNGVSDAPQSPVPASTQNNIILQLAEMRALVPRMPDRNSANTSKIETETMPISINAQASSAPAGDATRRPTTPQNFHLAARLKCVSVLNRPTFHPASQKSAAFDKDRFNAPSYRSIMIKPPAVLKATPRPSATIIPFRTSAGGASQADQDKAANARVA